ncbi:MULTISPECIES: hypothetical protein [unclassified Acinetobacter]|uniref:dTMP kinase n=1 Tax=unclassified Acinetobacter TaxID=196816 RepID=UPI002934AB9D|nr:MULTISPECIES: hypothetical protein [unclassified Acinetobacter]WOE33285.1 hypothetical protein QSG84_15400 [Acinetobacter sp. SAAs470]WOE36937.1 hypothetical protein QSG86_00765 [Acinetobacter sp. SAAs474]
MLTKGIIQTLQEVKNTNYKDQAIYIGFTGLDGAGKSTQAGMLGQYLRSFDRQCYVCEPKDDLVPQLSIAIGKNNSKSPREYFGTYPFELSKAFSVVRHHYSGILPFLNSGIDVIEPRTNFCRLGLAIAHDCDEINKVVDVYEISKKYDFVFWIDTPPEIAYKRVNDRGTDYEPFEELDKFHKALCQIADKTCIRINEIGSKDDVFNRIKLKLNELIGKLDK